MFPRSRSRFRLSLFLCLVLLITLVSPVQGTSRAQTAFEENNAIRATVLIQQVFVNPQGEVIVACEGSGTLVSSDGLILTNAHVALKSELCPAQRLVISLTLRNGEAPVPIYYAEVVGFNRGYDLAVLQIVQTLDNRPVERSTLLLPFVELGDSEAVILDDTIQLVGYTTPDGSPKSGTASIVRGSISGFTAETRVGSRAWLKTRAVIPGGMSGGGAYNIEGKLIGVPTIEPNRSDGENVDCRRLQDSNSDGQVDQKDTCIPISGVINAMRPARLARGLLLAAKLQLSPRVLETDSLAASANQATPTFSRLFFAPGINTADMPTSVTTGMPTGSTDLYLFFDYVGMRDGLIYELRVTRDGIPDPTFSLAPATWSGGERGLWYIGNTGQVWPNGVYEFTLFINGLRAGDGAKITVGGGPRDTPQMTDILFGVPTPQGELANTGAILPVSDIINAEFVFNNMRPETTWRQSWYYENVKLFDSAVEPWNQGPNGKRRISAAAPAGQSLQPGRYRLELWADEQLAATSDFTMIGSQVDLNTEIFSGLEFATSLSVDDPARVTGTTFTNQVTDLYLTFSWRDIAAGTPWTWRWTVDDNPLFEVTQPWTNSPSGTGMWAQLQARGTIPDGSYRLDLVAGGVVRASATAKVGLGQLPVTTFGVAEGVELQGRIIDAESKQGISGVAVIILKPEFNVADFTNNMNEIFGMSLTDSQGRFTLSTLLPREARPQFYSIIILAKGYLPLASDGIEISATTPSPLIFQLEMNKD